MLSGGAGAVCGIPVFATIVCLVFVIKDPANVEAWICLGIFLPVAIFGVLVDFFPDTAVSLWDRITGQKRQKEKGHVSKF